jgi:type II secretory pathway pseudopilin PulG
MTPGNKTGVILLEVVLSLALLAAAMGTVAAGLASSYRAIERLDLNNQACDLAVTVMSEIQMGIIPADNSGPNAFENGPEDWTWQVAAEPVLTLMDGPAFARVDVTITRVSQSYTLRQSMLMLMPETTITTETPAEAPQ